MRIRRKVTALTLGAFFALAGTSYAAPTVLPGHNDQPGNSDCTGHSSDVPPGLYKNNC